MYYVQSDPTASLMTGCYALLAVVMVN